MPILNPLPPDVFIFEYIGSPRPRRGARAALVTERDCPCGCDLRLFRKLLPENALPGLLPVPVRQTHTWKPASVQRGTAMPQATDPRLPPNTGGNVSPRRQQQDQSEYHSQGFKGAHGLVSTRPLPPPAPPQGWARSLESGIYGDFQISFG